MKIKINSIKNRILFGFLFITLISFLLSILSYYYLNKINRIRGLDRKISKVEVLSLNLIKTDNDFFDLESINENFFLTKKSNILKVRDSIKQVIDQEMRELPEAMHPFFDIGYNLLQIDTALTAYNAKFELLADKIFKRGFRDYGVEGEMREYAHALEHYEDEISLARVLSLRRHEKDFLLRNDEQYIKKHHQLSSDIITTLEQNRESEKVVELVRQYANAFQQLVAIQREIGLNSNEGLRHELNDLTFALNDAFSRLSRKTDRQAEGIITNVIIIYIFTSLVTIIMSLVLSYFIALRLSKPVKRLSLFMNKVMDKKYNENIKFSLQNPTSELENLSKSFLSLMRRTDFQMREIQKNSAQMKKKNNELKKLNEELDKFIYSTAHDLRSPLSSVLGLINLAKYDKSDALRDKYLDLMEGSVSKMEKFIRDVVDYSKNKKLEIDIEPVDIKELINSVLEDHKYIPAYKVIKQKVVVEGNDMLYTDRNRLKIVLNNLVSNAVRYSDPEKDNSFIDVKVSIKKKTFELYFADNGVGIDKNHLNKIFKMFYRASESSSGSGLGLFILNETVHRLGGKVEVTSQVNIGTTFSFSFPNKATAYKRKNQKAA